MSKCYIYSVNVIELVFINFNNAYKILYFSIIPGSHEYPPRLFVHDADPQGLGDSLHSSISKIDKH